MVEFDKNKFQSNMAKLESQCKINSITSKNLIVDDYTYLHFRKTKTPMSFTYIYFQGNEKSINNFYTNVSSDGLIVKCSMLDQNAQINKAGNICCISGKDLKKIMSK